METPISRPDRDSIVEYIAEMTMWASFRKDTQGTLVTSGVRPGSASALYYTIYDTAGAIGTFLLGLAWQSAGWGGVLLIVARRLRGWRVVRDGRASPCTGRDRPAQASDSRSRRAHPKETTRPGRVSPNRMGASRPARRLPMTKMQDAGGVRGCWDRIEFDAAPV